MTDMNGAMQQGMQQTPAYGPGYAPGYGPAFGQQSSYAPPAAYVQQPGYPMPAYGAPAPGQEPGYGMPAYPAQPMYSMPGQAGPYAPAVAVPDPHGGMAIAGLVLGIISVLASLLPLCGFPLTIAALVFSILGRKSASRRTMATVGLALSIFAFVLTILSAAYGAYAATH